jgi:hypothetical protein
VVFPVGYNSSTGCTSIPVTSDAELEEDETFTITITSAGTAPYAVVVIPSIASVTIIDDDRRDEGEGSVNLAALVGGLIGGIVVAAVVSFLLGVVCTRYSCYCRRRLQPPPEPYYDDIVLNPSAAQLAPPPPLDAEDKPNRGPCRLNNDRSKSDFDGILTIPNQAYVATETLR